MTAQTDLFNPPRTTFRVYPVRRSDQLVLEERLGSFMLYDGPNEDHARVALHHTTMCARLPAVMAEQLPNGRTGRMIQEQPPRRRRACRTAG